MKKLVTITGGTGGWGVLEGLKNYDLDLRSIVSMADNGGRTGQLRDRFGVLPAGDLRRCLAALAETENGHNYLRELFLYDLKNHPGDLGEECLGDLVQYALKEKYPDEIYGVWAKMVSLDPDAADLFDFKFGGQMPVADHSLGNLIINAAELKYGNMAEGIKKLSKLLKLKGRVYPVSLEDYHLAADLEDGSIIIGETNIDRPNGERAPIHKIKLGKLEGDTFKESRVEVYKKSAESIERADLIIIGPGDLYTSILPSLLVEGVTKAIRDGGAKIVGVCNLMTKHGETDEYKASDFKSKLESYLGQPLDYFICNQNSLTPTVLDYYAREQRQYAVEADLPINSKGLILGHFVSDEELKEGHIRHDPYKLAKELIQIADNI